MKKDNLNYRDKLSKKFKSFKKLKSENTIKEELIDQVMDSGSQVLEVRSSGSLIKIPIDKIIMIKKQAFKSVFYLVSNEKIVSNLSLEDWLVLLPGHKFIKSADDIIFQKAFI
ncbi:MAG TPA: hypothetical protein PK147_07020 [Saprospiraceae bacterium]|nr:hypothetical protein [Saprospiraceae bacterium]MCB9327616.1 hypothetical protein [Lewinellaceae bacterium]HPQ21586.1 hypothetical protein [Saprospiraceae bacterium]HRX27776.1 hypothetical protein [Saprospiraceae bacterium]